MTDARRHRSFVVQGLQFLCLVAVVTFSADNQIDGADGPLSEIAGTCEQGFPDAMWDAEIGRPLEYQQRKKRLAGVESVSLDQFDAAWKIDLDVERQPAREVLDGLLSEMGLRLPDDADLDEVLQRPVSLKRRAVSRLQAIEELCSQIGLYPDYTWESEVGSPLFEAVTGTMQAALGLDPSSKNKKPAVSEKSAITLHPGKRPFPIAFAGPFAIEVNRLEEFPPYASAILETRVFAGGISPSVRAYWKKKAWRGLEIQKVMAPDGRDLLTEDRNIFPWQKPSGLPSRTFYRELMNLLGDVRSVRIRAMASAEIPVHVETIRIDHLVAGAVKRGEEFCVRVDEIWPTPTDTSSTPSTEAAPSPQRGGLSVTVEGTWGIPIEFIALDAAGKAIGVDFFFFGGSYFGPSDVRPTKRSGRLYLAGVPRSLIAKAFVVEKTIDYPVELVADLQSFAEQPAQLTVLEFSGTAPVAIEVIRMSGDEPFRKVHIRATNHSNKDIRFVECKLNYLDPSGRVLEDHRTRLAVPFFLDARARRVLVATNRTAETEATAFDAPDTMSTTTVTLEGVQFADGTRWTR